MKHTLVVVNLLCALAACATMSFLYGTHKAEEHFIKVCDETQMFLREGYAVSCKVLKG